MDVVEAEKHLSCDLFDDMFGNTSILIPLDEAQQVFAEDLKDHADVLPARNIFSVQLSKPCM